jgi:hypothetical protein
MIARPSFRALRSGWVSTLALGLGLGLPLAGIAAEPPDEVPGLSEESLRKFRRLYDPDIPVAFRAEETAGVARSGARGALAPNESRGGNWWSGFAAHPAGQGLQSSVNVMAEYGGSLVVAGDFRRAGGDIAHRVAMWDGASWTPLGLGMNFRVFALEEYGGKLIAGGAFTLADLSTANFVAAWDGNSWEPLGHGPGGPVYALQEYEGVLYAGGDFQSFLATWDGTAWIPDSTPPNGIVATLAVADSLNYGSTLLAGGVMVRWGNQGDNSGSFIFRLSRSSGRWIRLNRGANNWVNTMHVVNSDTVYVGGNFSAVRNGSPFISARRVVGYTYPIGDPPARYFALGDETGNGVNDAVLAITDFGGNIVVGGQFDTATNSGGGAIVANRIATWDGTLWSALGTGVSGGLYAPHVRALQTFGTDLYAGGWFTSAGGADSRHIARWIDIPAPAPPVSVREGVAGGPDLAVTVAPNPFAWETRISFASPMLARVTLSVHDVQGRRVRTLLEAEGVEGVRTASWDGRDEEGRRLSSGVYFVRLERDGVPVSRRVVLTR